MNLITNIKTLSYINIKMLIMSLFINYINYAMMGLKKNIHIIVCRILA